MKSFTVSILCWFAIFLCYCSAQKTTKTVKQVFNQEQFDTAVISHLFLYDSLKNILVANIDTIFNFRKSKRTSENKPIPVSPEELFYNFIYIAGKGESSDKISLETLPAPIYSKVDNICRQLGSNRIAGFDLQRNKVIVNIIVKNDDDEETLAETQHTLTWNWSNKTDGSGLVKDSVLGHGWIYSIQTDVWKGR